MISVGSVVKVGEKNYSRSLQAIFLGLRNISEIRELVFCLRPAGMGGAIDWDTDQFPKPDEKKG